MKKFIAVLVCFAVIFAFAACTKDVNEGTTAVSDTTVSLPDNVKLDANGNPVTEYTDTWVTDADGVSIPTRVMVYATHAAGDMVVGADGNVVTVPDFGFILDENGQPQTGANGEPLTTYVYVPATYPTVAGETMAIPTAAPTKPVGNTNPSKNQKWLTQEFMAKLPKLRDNVDEAIYVTTSNGQYVNIRINELSYADFLKYIETCKEAGFTQRNTGAQIPQTPVAGKSYIYSSNANGLYVTITYYTDEYPYRTCDLYITVSDYNMLEKGVGEIEN